VVTSADGSAGIAPRIPGDHRALRQIERLHLLAQDLRVEERFGFDSHLPGDRVCGAGKKPGPFAGRTSDLQHPTSKPEHCYTAEKPQESDLDKLV